MVENQLQRLKQMAQRWVMVGLVSIMMTLPACRSMSHAANKARAQEQWSHVRARVKFQLARQQYEGRLFEDAAHTVSEALSLDPLQVDAYGLLARAQLELGKIASAEQALRSARQAGLCSADLLYTEGVVLEQRDRPEEALDRFAQAHDLDPANLDFLVALVECLVTLGRVKEASTILEDSADRVNDDGSMAILSARIALLRGDSEGAIRGFRAALTSSGQCAAVAEELGLLLTRAGRWNEGLALLQPLETHCADAMSATNSAKSPLESTLRPRSAQDRKQDEPDSFACGSLRRGLAQCYLMLRDPASARNELLDYARANPADLSAQLLLAQAALELEDLLTAAEALDRARLQDPQRREVRILTAMLGWRRGDPPSAIDILGQWLNDNPDDSDAHCLLAEVLLTQQEVDLARRHFEQALRIDPRCDWATLRLKSL